MATIDKVYGRKHMGIATVCGVVGTIPILLTIAGLAGVVLSGASGYSFWEDMVVATMRIGPLLAVPCALIAVVSGRIALRHAGQDLRRRAIAFIVVGSVAMAAGVLFSLLSG